MVIGKIIATEKQPSTIEEFTFWTKKDLKLKPFDVVVVEHINNSRTFGVVEEISHMTDSPSALAGYISSDFGDVDSHSYTERIGMNYVRCKVVGNDAGIYIPVQEGRKVSLATEQEIMMALGLDSVKHPIPAGFIRMYDDSNAKLLPVNFNSAFFDWTRRCPSKYLRYLWTCLEDIICDVLNESNPRCSYEETRGVRSFYYDECKRYRLTQS